MTSDFVLNPYEELSAGYEAFNLLLMRHILPTSANKTVSEESGDYYPVFYSAFAWSKMLYSTQARGHDLLFTSMIDPLFCFLLSTVGGGSKSFFPHTVLQSTRSESSSEGFYQCLRSSASNSNDCVYIQRALNRQKLEVPPGSCMPPRGIQPPDSESTAVGQERGLGWLLSQWPLTFDLQYLISSFLSPSAALCQIWQKSPDVFLTYYAHKIQGHSDIWPLKSDQFFIKSGWRFVLSLK